MIGLVIVATGKYKSFIKSLLKTAETHFFHGLDVRAHVFTDNPNEINHSGKIKLSCYRIDAEKWPGPTLHRYRYFLERKESIMSYNPKWIFYIDADMRFYGPVQMNILPKNEKKYTVVRHPGFFNGGWGSENVDPHSTAFIEDFTGKHYYAGGFNGGTAEAFWEMAETCDDNIRIDEENGVLAQWHDESHMNKFLLDKDVMALDPGYCYPQSWNLPFKKRILALDKDHKKIRQ